MQEEGRDKMTTGQGFWGRVSKSKLLDQERDRRRALHQSIRTEKACVGWARKFLIKNKSTASGLAVRLLKALPFPACI